MSRSAYGFPRSAASSTSTCNANCAPRLRAAATPVRARTIIQRLQGILGQPGDNNALETVFNGFVTALQSLSTSPDSGATRYGVLTAAQTLAQHLNGMTADIQGMRGDAELALSDAVNQANSALRNIADDQSPARPHQRPGCHDRDAAGPARLLPRPALAADGHQGGPVGPQSGSGVHARRHATRRRPRGQHHFRCQGLALGGLAMGRRSDANDRSARCCSIRAPELQST